METLKKIIAVDFDGMLFTDKYPDIGEPIVKNIERLKKEQEEGARTIFWSNRVGKYQEDALAACELYDIYFDAINENLPEVLEAFNGDPRKVYADEYWDDRAVFMSEQDIGDFSDGYHTFNELYTQRLMLSVALFNCFKEISWKSRKHSDGEPCFGGGWFIVGIETPEGSYTYHYEDKFWDLFKCREVTTAKEWDGHTDKDVSRLISLLPFKEEQEGYQNLSPFEQYKKRRANRAQD
jgi:hypothetical protein